MTGRPRKELPDEIRAMLGTMPDHIVAERAGVDRKTIMAARKRENIPAPRRGGPLVSMPKPPPRDPSGEDVARMTRIEYLELQLDELRQAEKQSTGVALSQLKRQEREVWDELEVARKAEELKAEKGKRSTSPDQLLSQSIIPRVLKMSRIHREALYLAIGESLGVVDPQAA